MYSMESLKQPEVADGNVADETETSRKPRFRRTNFLMMRVAAPILLATSVCFLASNIGSETAGDNEDPSGIIARTIDDSGPRRNPIPSDCSSYVDENDAIYRATGWDEIRGPFGGLDRLTENKGAKACGDNKDDQKSAVAVLLGERWKDATRSDKSVTDLAKNEFTVSKLDTRDLRGPSGLLSLMGGLAFVYSLNEERIKKTFGSTAEKREANRKKRQNRLRQISNSFFQVAEIPVSTARQHNTSARPTRTQVRVKPTSPDKANPRQPISAERSPSQLRRPVEYTRPGR